MASITLSPTGSRRTSRCVAIEILGAHRGFWLRAGVAGRFDEDPAFGRAIGVDHIDLHEKAIELGLGKGVCALLLQRILRREHVKGARQIVPFAGDRDVIFLHRLEQRRLGSGACPVDFVGHQQLGEYRSPHKMKTAAPVGGLFQDFGAENIGGHQIGRELDAARLQAKNNAKGFDELGFGEPRHTDEQAVPARKKRDQGLLDNLPLTEDDGLDRTPRRGNPFQRGLGGARHGGFERSGHCFRHGCFGLLACCLNEPPRPALPFTRQYHA